MYIQDMYSTIHTKCTNDTLTPHSTHKPQTHTIHTHAAHTCLVGIHYILGLRIPQVDLGTSTASNHIATVAHETATPEVDSILR